MKKFFYLFNISIFIMIVYLLFKISYKTNDVKNEITLLKKKINKDKDDIRILQAEWTYLSNPKRIQELSRKHLNIKLQSKQQIRKNQEILVMNEEIESEDKR